MPADWTDDQARAYALADNRTAELAEWDDVVLADMLAELDAGGWDLNSIGFDGLPEIAPGDADDDVPDADEARVDREARRRLGARRAPRRLRIVDRRRRSWRRCSATGWRTSCSPIRPTASTTWRARRRPPRSAGRPPASTGHRERRALVDGLVELLRDALGLSWTHAREGAGCYVFHSDARRVEFEGAMGACGWHVAQNLVWVKDAFVLGMMDYHSQHEPVLYGWKPGGRHAWYGGRKRTALVADQQPDLDAWTATSSWRCCARSTTSSTSSGTIGRGAPTSTPP